MSDGTVKIDTDLDSSGLKSGLASIGSVATKALSAATAAVAAGVVAIAKSAVSAYADYEQLVGGVETLFSESADIVMDYANNAFKTAGLSANEYMETVTSFSASLLQGLNGDTAEAARIADVAITDMADNANKMGTSMESIQNAYQGFAKQNYTMLDNLKLGYGGTKTEMERLLADATTLSGMEYNIDNLNDVIEAIHVIQEDMGITGTTAQEASTTIQGSIASMKAAWENMLVGLADDTQDFDALLTNLIDSVGTVLENLLPRVKTALSGVTQLFGALLPEIAEMLPELISDLVPEIAEIAVTAIQTLAQGLSDNASMLADSAIDIMTTLVEGFLTIMPELAITAVQLITALVEGIASAIPTLIPAAVSAIMTLVQGLIDNIPSLISAALQLIQGLMQGLIEAIPVLLQAIPTIITSLVTALLSSIPEIIQAGITLLVSLVEALPDIITTIVEAIPQIIDGIVTALVENIPLIIQTGIELLVSLIQALPQIITTIITALPQIISSIVSTLISNIPLIIQAGIDLLISLVSALPEIIVEIVKAIPEIIAAIVSGFLGLIGEIIEVGKNIVKGVWDGIVSMANWIKEKVTGFFQNIVSSVKGLLGIQSPSKVFAKEVGEQIPAGTAQGITKGTRYTTAAIKKFGSSMISESKTYLEKYQDLMESSTSADLTRWDEISKAYEAALDGRSDEDKEYYNSYAQMMSDIQSIEDNYQNQLASRTDQLANFVSLFSEVSREAADGDTLTGNLRSQVTALEDYGAAINELYARGVNENLIAELEEMGPDAVDEIAALAAMTDEQLTEYQELWAQKYMLAREQAIEQLQGLREESDDEIAQLKQSFEDELGEMPEWMAEIGYEMSLGMAEGIERGTSAVVGSIQSLIGSTLEGARSAAEIQSPSKLFKRLVGLDIGRGVGVGITDSMADVRKIMQNEVRSLANVGTAAMQSATPSSATVGTHGSVSSDSASEKEVEIGLSVVPTGDLRGFFEFLDVKLEYYRYLDGKGVRA